MESAGACWLEAWAKAHGTHTAPLFPAGEDVLPRSGKENIWDMFDAGIGEKREYLLGVGIGEALMQGCSNVHITEEFASFFKITFDAVV